MKIILLSVVFVFVALLSNAQRKRTILKPVNPLSEDSTQFHKIIPAEIPQPILDSLQEIKHFGIQDVYTAHRNGNNTVYVIEIAHDIVRDVFWFDPRGRQLRPSARKGN
jgi:hypothetical protein